MPHINIYLDEALDAEMAKRGKRTNWSAVAQEAFRAELALPVREYNGPVFEHLMVENVTGIYRSGIIQTHEAVGWQLCSVDDKFMYFKRELT